MPATELYDIFVIGGGVNGCGIARDAAGRGYSVYLAEMNDLASGTSSAATKLIHGGLRYLEHYEFRLVHEALKEREVLWAMAPHVVRPLRLVLPHHKGLRPTWLLRLGLFIYDHLGGRKLLPPTKTLDMRSDAAGKPLKPVFTKAFEFSDCWVDDARLVVLNAMDAAARGATIATQAAVVAAERQGGIWQVDVRHADGTTKTIRARVLVNAAGPWVDRVVQAIGEPSDVNVRLVQGSHIVVPQLYEHDRCYFFQNGDGRIMFVIPYEGEFSLIGTTDRDYRGDPSKVRISSEEIDYLCAAASEYFVKPVTREDVVWSYSGVRPLYDNGAGKAQETTRDYVIKSDGGDGAAPLVNVIGGKLTTYRRLTESVLEKIEGLIGAKKSRWTASAPLPGGDFPATGYEAQVTALKGAYLFLSKAYARRLVRLYGTLASRILDDAQDYAALGQNFGADLYAAEVRYLIDHEWARTTDDVLWRRTKRGLHAAEIDVEALTRFMAETLQARS